MDIDEFNKELRHFLYYQNHNYRFKGHDIDLGLAETILNQLSSAMMNSCVEFVFADDSLIVYKDCYRCGREPCNMEFLSDVMKKFKKTWRGNW